MKKLFVVRHGEYDDDGLTDPGKAQVRASADAIKSRILGKIGREDIKTIILTSSFRRAQESAAIIQGDADALLIKADILCAGSDGLFDRCVERKEEDFPVIFRLVRGMFLVGFDVVVVVSHSGVVDYILHHFTGNYIELEKGAFQEVDV